MNAVPESAPLGAAWMFLIIVSLLVGIGGVTLSMVGCCGFLGLAGPPGGGSRFMQMAVSGLIGSLVAALVIVVNVGLWGGCAHGLLKITGGTRFSIGRTYQALCYSSGPMVLAAIPLVGMVMTWWIAPIWWTVGAVLTVARGQGVSGGRASFAVLTYPLLFVVLGVGGYMASILFLIGGMRASGAFMLPQNEITTINSALITYAADNGTWPGHPVQLISDEVVPSTAFVSWSGPTPLDPSLVNISDTDLQSFELLPTNRRDIKAQSLADAQPADLVAQRVGDTVFTYFGIDPADADPGLWLVVLAPQTASTPNTGSTPPPAWQPTYQVWVGRADGAVVNITGTIGKALAEQNALRAQEGLPPLPDPTTLAPGGTATSDSGAAAEPGDS